MRYLTQNIFFKSRLLQYRQKKYLIISKQFYRFTDSDKKYRIIKKETNLINFGLLAFMVWFGLFRGYMCLRTIFFKIRKYVFDCRVAWKWILWIFSPLCSQKTLHVSLFEKTIDQKNSFFDCKYHFYPLMKMHSFIYQKISYFLFFKMVYNIHIFEYIFKR